MGLFQFSVEFMTFPIKVSKIKIEYEVKTNMNDKEEQYIGGLKTKIQ